jgi:hypothetical protein
MNVFKTFNRYAPFKLFKTSEKTVPLVQTLQWHQMCRAQYLIRRLTKGFRRSSCLLRSRTSAYLCIGMRRVSRSKQLERLEQFELLELLKSVRLHGGN